MSRGRSGKSPTTPTSRGGTAPPPNGTGEEYTRQQPKIFDRCPSCGQRSLFIGAGGFLTCGVILCKNPGVGDVVAGMKAEIATLRAEARRWYTADGTFEEMEPAEVIERRKAAAKALDRAASDLESYALIVGIGDGASIDPDLIEACAKRARAGCG